MLSAQEKMLVGKAKMLTNKSKMQIKKSFFIRIKFFLKKFYIDIRNFIFPHKRVKKRFLKFTLDF